MTSPDISEYGFRDVGKTFCQAFSSGSWSSQAYSVTEPS